MSKNAEQQRLDEAREGGIAWKRWGPYLSERQWGTVREDYSDNGDAWNYFTHDQARSRAYRWGEDGLAGISDDHQRLCFALALWNGQDPILKERAFGLANSEGNHGEDVKEYYFYLDSTPTHSYMKYLYKYPQAAYPYDDLVATNRSRGKHEAEYELLDTGVFDDNRYFDVVRRVRQGRARRHPDPHHACAIAAPMRRRFTSCRRCGFATPGRGRDGGAKPRSRSAALAGHAAVHARHADAPLLGIAGGLLPVLRRRRAAAVHRERDEQRAALRLGQRLAVCEGRHRSTASSMATRPR